MTQPRRPDQRPEQPIPYAPGSRSGAALQAGSLNTAGLALDTTVAAVNATLAVPAQDTTVASVLSQIVNNGAQPWVPNMHSASSVLKNPAGSPYTFHTFTKNSRIWGAIVTAGMGTSGGAGTTNAYALVRTGGNVVLSIVEVAVAGTVSNSSGSSPQQIPGIPVLAGDSVVLDVNAGVGISGGTMRASCTVLYSVP